MSEITFSDALARLQTGTDADINALYADCYADLRRIAHSRLFAAHLKSHFATESLLHESYLKLANASAAQFRDRSHFFAYASKMMRNIIVDTVREANAQRRGAGQADLTLSTEIANICPAASDVNVIDDALKDLQAIDPALAALVEMRFFGGLTEIEIGETLGVSERTVRREWAKARAALLVLLENHSL